MATSAAAAPSPPAAPGNLDDDIGIPPEATLSPAPVMNTARRDPSARIDPSSDRELEPLEDDRDPAGGGREKSRFGRLRFCETGAGDIVVQRGGKERGANSKQGFEQK